jgi:hypothetical protein
MTNEDKSNISIIQKVVRRVGNPLEWSYVDKALVLLLLDISLKIPFALGGYIAIKKEILL